MSKNTSISLGGYFDDFVQNSIKAGKFKNVSEVIRAGLRLLEKEETKIDILSSELELGENSKLIEDFDPKKHLTSLKKKHL
jgi:antitoxin ParD1/3/4